MGVVHRVEDMGEERNRSIAKMLQCLVRDNVRARGHAEVKNGDGFVNLVRHS